MFVNNILKEQNFRFIVPAEVNVDAFTRLNILRANIENKLKEANLLFNNINFLFFDFESVSNSFTERSNRLPFRKSDSTIFQPIFIFFKSTLDSSEKPYFSPFISNPGKKNIKLI